MSSRPFAAPAPQEGSPPGGGHDFGIIDLYRAEPAAVGPIQRVSAGSGAPIQMVPCGTCGADPCNCAELRKMAASKSTASTHPAHSKKARSQPWRGTAESTQKSIDEVFARMAAQQKARLAKKK